MSRSKGSETIKFISPKPESSRNPLDGHSIGDNVSYQRGNNDHDNTPDRLSRRNFLKVVLGGLSGVLIPSELIGFQKGLTGAKKDKPLATEANESDLSDLLLKHRRKFGINTLPNILKEDLQAPIEVSELSIVGDQKDYELVSLVQEFLDVFFGENDPLKFVYGLDLTTVENSFASNTREVRLNTSVTDGYIRDKTFIGLLLHEVAGHSTDTSRFNGIEIVDKDKILALEEAKWRALLQVVNVPGEFFNHQGDLHLERIIDQTHLQLGRSLWDRNIDAAKLPFLEEAQVYNTEVCRQISDHYISLFPLENEDDVPQFVKDIISPHFEPAFIEIFAEMIRLTLEPFPEYAPNNDIASVQTNPVISSAIEDYLKIITQEPELTVEEIRARLKGMSIYSTNNNLGPKDRLFEIQHDQEFGPGRESAQAYTDENQNKFESDEVEDFIVPEETEPTLFEIATHNFYLEGTLPLAEVDIPDESLQILENYAQAVSELYRSSSVYVGIRYHNDNFEDPFLHYWDSDLIAYVSSPIEVENILNFLLNNSTSEEITEDYLSNRMLVFTQVINSLLDREGHFNYYNPS